MDRQIPDFSGVGSAGVAGATASPRRAGVYVHFPYCLAKCPYCDFVSYAVREGQGVDHAAYADAVIGELDRRRTAFDGRSVESIFFGGGTPSLWEPRELGRVLSAVRAALPPRPGCEVEVTVECNPTSLDEGRAKALVDQGVDRLSVGVQSTRDESLRFLGRLHDARGGVAAVKAALGAADRVSADLIFGLPGQTPQEACDEALQLADLGLRHLSAYQLTIEPGTRFGELARRGRLPLANDGAVAESFLAVHEALSSRGLQHYEISNYATPGQEARHNLGYWRGDEYLGLGCAAYGFVRSEPSASPGAGDEEPGARGERWRNETVPERYVGGAGAEREPLDAATMLRERIMLGLRTRDGVDIAEQAADLGIVEGGWTVERTRAAERLERSGRLERDGTTVRVPPSAWLWADDTASRLM
jgi:oxygen-independent coproporphyrinogen-3 oxidase